MTGWESWATPLRDEPRSTAKAKGQLCPSSGRRQRLGAASLQTALRLFQRLRFWSWAEPKLNESKCSDTSELGAKWVLLELGERIAAFFLNLNEFSTALTVELHRTVQTEGF